ncbi:MAG: hypothetical protein HC767_14495 [Akkermansiaceae bacterium]|nr:hypothetical protein [Akkermansiaceae bacterium]
MASRRGCASFHPSPYGKAAHGWIGIEVSLHTSLADVPAAEWDALACPEAADGGRPRDPFTTHRFLAALDRSGSTGRRSPLHVTRTMSACHRFAGARRWRAMPRASGNRNRKSLRASHARCRGDRGIFDHGV